MLQTVFNLILICFKLPLICHQTENANKTVSILFVFIWQFHFYQIQCFVWIENKPGALGETFQLFACLVLFDNTQNKKLHFAKVGYSFLFGFNIRQCNGRLILVCWDKNAPFWWKIHELCPTGPLSPIKQRYTIL